MAFTNPASHRVSHVSIPPTTPAASADTSMIPIMASKSTPLG